MNVSVREPGEDRGAFETQMGIRVGRRPIPDIHYRSVTNDDP
jgi:hypothetical protein